jgi:hypothetical protein
MVLYKFNMRKEQEQPQAKMLVLEERLWQWRTLETIAPRIQTRIGSLAYFRASIGEISQPCLQAPIKAAHGGEREARRKAIKELITVVRAILANLNSRKEIPHK